MGALLKGPLLEGTSRRGGPLCRRPLRHFLCEPPLCVGQRVPQEGGRAALGLATPGNSLCPCDYAGKGFVAADHQHGSVGETRHVFLCGGGRRSSSFEASGVTPWGEYGC